MHSVSLSLLSSVPFALDNYDEMWCDVPALYSVQCSQYIICERESRRIAAATLLFHQAPLIITCIEWNSCCPSAVLSSRESIECGAQTRAVSTTTHPTDSGKTVCGGEARTRSTVRSVLLVLCNSFARACVLRPLSCVHTQWRATTDVMRARRFVEKLGSDLPSWDR